MTALTRSRIARLAVVALASVPCSAAAQQSRSARGNSLTAIGIHGFSVVLIVGSLQGAAASPTENVPEAAKKALSDMKDFLPFKRYQLLDAAWTLCCASFSSGVTGRVRGPDDRDYTYAVDPLGAADSKLNLRFSMREAADSPWHAASGAKPTASPRAEYARQLSEAMREQEDAEAELRAVRAKYTDAAPQTEAAKVRRLRAASRVEELRRVEGGARVVTSSARNIMDSTFSIAAGETVVVGTSRLNGDQALIAILTAAAKPGAPR